MFFYPLKNPTKAELMILMMSPMGLKISVGCHIQSKKKKSEKKKNVASFSVNRLIKLMVVRCNFILDLLKDKPLLACNF